VDHAADALVQLGQGPQAGAAAATSRSSCTSSAVISWVSCSQRRAIDRSASLAASVGVAGLVAGRSRAAVVTSSAALGWRQATQLGS
jgi:hypothetical protein